MPNNKFLIILFTIFCLACKKQGSNPVFDDKPVIEGYLQVGDTARLNISRLTPFDTTAKYSKDDINNLKVSIRYNDTTYVLSALGNGNYIAKNPTLIVKLNQTYSLSVIYNNKVTSAVTTIPSKPKGYTQSVSSFSRTQITTSTTTGSSGFVQLDPVKLTWGNTDNSYYLIVVESMETNPEPVNLRVSNDFVRRFKNQPTQTNTYEIRAQQFQYFGKYRLILYHLNPDYAQLYINNNNNSNNLTNSETSVVNGAGIFTGLNSDTLYLKVLKQ